MKDKILAIVFSFCFLFTNFKYVNAQTENITNNHRIYEPFNLSDTKNLKVKASSVIDFSSFEKNKSSINGLYKGKYVLTNQNDGNSTAKLGLTFTSSIEDLKNFSIDVDGENVDYTLKFLDDKFKVPTGNDFYKEIKENFSSSDYDIKNYKKDDIGVLREFNLESNNTQDLTYEVIVKYYPSKTKVFLSGGKDITSDDKEDDDKKETSQTMKVLRLTYDLSGKYKKPMLFAIGDDINIITKVYSGEKELTSGYRENIEKKSISVLDFFKEMFLNDIPENIKQKISEQNFFEIFAQSFDKILGGVGYDNLGLLSPKSEKQILVSLQFPLESKKEKKLNVIYPISTEITTVNSTEVLKLNLELSALSSFDKFEKIDYKIIGNNEYKYIVDSNVKYKNTKDDSVISINKLPDKVVETLLYKEKFLKGVTRDKPRACTNYVLPIVAIFEVVSVIYLRNTYFRKKVNKSYKN